MEQNVLRLHSVTVAPLAEILGAEWSEGEQQGEEGKGPDYVEFYLSTGSVKACYGFTFDDFDRMREDIRSMYPDLIKRWGRSTVRSKTLTPAKPELKIHEAYYAAPVHDAVIGVTA